MEFIQITIRIYLIFFEHMCAEIIFSYTAIESFVNECIPHDFKYKHKQKGEIKVLVGPEIEKIITMDEKLKKYYRL